MKTELKLTDYDQLILESYKHMIPGLGEYLGSGYEVVLHSLESYDHSVIAIHNGHYTGRAVGAPITNKALEMLEVINKDKQNENITYFSTNRDGKPMKSTTIPIWGKEQKVIGLLCINFYMDIPFTSILNDFKDTNHRSNSEQHEGLDAVHIIKEEFNENSAELITNMISSAQKQVYRDHSISASNKNKAIIQLLYDKGVFNFKDAVIIVSKILNISKNTVYLHLRNIK